jgi:U3 small nucleolar RNA-associated protein 12
VRVWTWAGELQVTLNGHRGAVTALSFNRNATQLLSGAADTDVIVWDLVAEAGLFRLRGHRDAVTGVCLLEEHSKIVSCSKDTLLKVRVSSAHLTLVVLHVWYVLSLTVCAFSFLPSSGMGH